MDGAMGTELQRLARSPIGRHLTEPQRACRVHSSYTAVGARVVLTNTFQTNPLTLAQHVCGKQHHSLWCEAIGCARNADPRPRFILGDVGPIQYCTKKTASSILTECSDLDGILLETWSSLADLRMFARALDDRTPPLLVSFTFHRSRRHGWCTFADVRPEACALAAQKAGAAALGVNCGRNLAMKQMFEIVLRYRGKCDLPIFIRPNAGTPKKTRTGWVYPYTPEAMAEKLPPLLQAGVAMVGGCCGTTPAHLAKFRQVIDEWNR